MVCWDAVEAIGTVLAAIISAIALVVAVRAIEQANKAIRLQLMPLVIPSSVRLVPLDQPEAGRLVFTLENQGNGPAISIRVSGVRDRLWKAEMTSLAPHKSAPLVLKPGGRADDPSAGQFCVEYRDCLGGDYRTRYALRAFPEELGLEDVRVEAPDLAARKRRRLWL